jgi:hypothetical protein
VHRAWRDLERLLLVEHDRNAGLGDAEQGTQRSESLELGPLYIRRFVGNRELGMKLDADLPVRGVAGDLCHGYPMQPFQHEVETTVFKGYQLPYLAHGAHFLEAIADHPRNDDEAVSLRDVPNHDSITWLEDVQRQQGVRKENGIGQRKDREDLRHVG